MRHFFGHVAGESHRNADGTDRQRIIPHCRVGELLVLEHEPDNPHDINAIRVLRQTGEQIGYLERELAGQVVSRSAKGDIFRAVIAGVGRAHGSGPYGVALLIVVDDEGADDDEIRAYARKILADEPREDGSSRELPQSTPERERDVPIAAVVGGMVFTAAAVAVAAWWWLSP